MGTRYFSAVEKKDSRIKWATADALTAQKLAAAINKTSHGLVTAKAARIVVFFPAVLLLSFLVGYIILVQGSPTPLAFSILFILAVLFFSAHFLIGYIKFRPYLYPERQPGIWIFRAKCSDIATRGAHNEYHYAFFDKGGGHIQIKISRRVYDSNPVGKVYIFYKFNDRPGNRWAAIAAEELDKY
ncbi:MAG: hypothetical protein ACK5LX_08195 [Oscillospiraceae bacterium]